VLLECERDGIRRVWATIRPTNVASRHVIESIGLHVDHTEVDEKGTLLYYTRLLRDHEQAAV
jgi:RimJ/RimL family protein N-acetyltransferase